MVGTALGIGAFVTVLGLTTTANAQVDAAFTTAATTPVTVTHASTGAGEAFPPDAESRVAALHGVEGVGLTWDISNLGVTRLPPDAQVDENTDDFRITAASPGYWRAVVPDLLWGRLFDSALDDQPVAVIGARIAGRLGVTAPNQPHYVYVASRPILVVGVVTSALRDEVSATSVVLPAAWVRSEFGAPTTHDQLIVATRIGAGRQVAGEVPTALDAYHPEATVASYPPAPQVLADRISAQLRRLFLALACVCIVLGGLGIANVTLFSVLERVQEIGLRRAMGALPRHVVLQFLIESSLLGGLGGLVGAVTAQTVVIAAAVILHWTPAMATWTTISGPPIGAAIGLLAGSYPAWRAARISPVVAFRQT